MKIIVKGAMTILFLSFLLPDAYAEDGMTWNDCVSEAAKNHPDLISAAGKLKQFRADKEIVRSSTLPQISSEVNSRRTGVDTGVTRSTSDTYSYGVTGKQLLFDGFKTSNDVGAASENIKASQYDYAVTSSNVRLNLSTAFAGLLRAQALLSITEDIALRRNQNLELVRLRYEAGREHEGSLLTAEADLAQAELEVMQAKRNITLAQRQLMKELGRKRFAPIKVIGDFEITEIDRVKPDFDYLADNTPLLKELIAKREAVRFGVKSVKADFSPQVYLDGSLGKSDSSWPPSAEQWSAGISLSFPLFEGGSRIAKVSKAKAELNQAKADEQSGRDGILFTLEKTWVEFQDAIDNISVRQKYLEAAEKRAKIANAQYSAGLISFNDWIIIEDNLVSTKKSFLDSRASMLITEANWIQARGGILEYDK
ncbi:MAG: TolC family protein [Candidatus Omnitrophota bacterium]